MGKRIWWAVLQERSTPEPCVNALLNVAQRAGQNGYRRLIMPYSRTDFARNAIAAKFMADSERENPADDDTLVMLDNDHNHPFDVIERIARWNLPIVAALAYRRGPPNDPCMFLASDKPGVYNAVGGFDRGNIIECDMVGHAAIAIQRKALVTMADATPLWRYVYRNDDFPSEDVYFSEVCKAHGIPLHCDTSVMCPHLTTAWVDDSQWQAHVKAHPEVLQR